MVHFLHILHYSLLLWTAHKKDNLQDSIVLICSDKLSPLILLTCKLTQNKGLLIIVWLHWGRGHHLSVRMESVLTESNMASWEEPPPERWGIYSLARWMASSGSGRQEIWLWLCRACVCVLSGPHSSIISYDIKHTAQWATGHSKAPDTTYCKNTHLEDELELFMWHICASEKCDSFEVAGRREVLNVWGDNVPSVTIIPLLCLWKIKNLSCSLSN